MKVEKVVQVENLVDKYKRKVGEGIDYQCVGMGSESDAVSGALS